MKTLPIGLQAHLDSGATTMCHCWRMTLRSGERFGFTEHDRAVEFDGTTFEAQAGFSGSEIESSLGLSIDNLDASGALTSGVLDESRLRAGDFDHALVELWRVNWQDVTQRVLMRKGHLGEVTAGTLGIRNHKVKTGAARIDLWSNIPFTVSVGDAVTLRAGCDKQLATCKAKFSNVINHRGFPHMPGNDFVMTFPTADDPKNNGGRRAN